MSVYLASDVPLPTPDWDEARPGFYVIKTPESEALILGELLSKPYLYTAGSYQGCGCGFQCDEEPIDEDCRRSRQELENYLTLALHDQPEVELYTCWGGPSSAFPSEPAQRERFTPQELIRDRPSFEEDECLMVVRPAS
jgi:hypothetical protein